MAIFLEKWVEDTARHRIIREIGVIESEYPAFQASLAGSAARGYLNIGDAGSASILLSVPSSRWFKPRMLWLHNLTNVQNRVQLYILGSGASCSASLPGAWVNPNDTAFIALDAITVDGDIYASNLVSNIQIKIGGILLNSGPQ